MHTTDIATLAQNYLANNWEQMLEDIATVVHIPSALDTESARNGAPFGEGPLAALEATLGIAQRMGFETRNLDGYIGIADMPATAPRANKVALQLGIIGHVDVVPEGPAWHFPAYELTQKDGYLIGRGVIDDKGPLLIALHAANCIKEAGMALPHSLRILIGTNEETGMHDVDYYLTHFESPDFLFTPDAEFPVCYGEKGHFDGMFSAGPFKDGQLISIEAGVAANAVPGTARACYLAEGKPCTLDVEGKSAHASTPQLGESALALLARKLIELNIGTQEEQSFLQFLAEAAACFDGGAFEIACEDDDFGALTSVIGMCKSEELAEGSRFSLSFDCRYPTSTNAQALERALSDYSQHFGVAFAALNDSEPFLLDPQSPAVQALLDAYQSATGESAKPFTMGGGTYARKFKTAASFGPEKPELAVPDWVGSMHGADEGVSIELLQQAFCIYVHTIVRLMDKL